MSYAERAVRKAVNVLERSYCGRLELSTFEGGERRREDSVIVSMTTFPARISYVHLAIKSLLSQTVIPEKLILWLVKDQFRDVAIPEQLRALCAYGLEIRFCDEDLLAHKKYYYAMRTFPEQVIVTYDDDIIYPEDSLEKLLMMHRKFPDAIICNRGREIEMNGGFVAPYKDWKVSGRVPAGLPSYRVMASTGAGTLYGKILSHYASVSCLRVVQHVPQLWNRYSSGICDAFCNNCFQLSGRDSGWIPFAEEAVFVMR